MTPSRMTGHRMTAPYDASTTRHRATPRRCPRPRPRGPARPPRPRVPRSEQPRTPRTGGLCRSNRAITLSLDLGWFWSLCLSRSPLAGVVAGEGLVGMDPAELRGRPDVASRASPDGHVVCGCEVE